LFILDSHGTCAQNKKEKRMMELISRLFPSLLTQLNPEKDELCEVIHVLAGIQNMWLDEPSVAHSIFVVTLEDRQGARCRFDLGLITYKSPWRHLQKGDKVLAVVKHKTNLPTEMKFVRVKEIYLKDTIEPLVLAA
jgi:hypothetical protein